jgi:hypothetical protein
VLDGDSSIEVPKGTEMPTPYSLENFGNQTAEDISLSLRGASNLDLSLDIDTIQGIPPGGTGEITLSGFESIDEDGRFRLRLSVESARVAEDSLQLIIEVVDKGTYVQRAVTKNSQLLARVENKIEGTVGLSGKLGSTEKRLNDTLRSIRDYDTRTKSSGRGGGKSNGNRSKGEMKSINNRIDSITNQYSAFINQLGGLSNSNKITGVESALLKKDTHDIIKILNKAKRADI